MKLGPISNRRYYVVIGSSQDEIEQKVERKFLDKWELQGGVAIMFNEKGCYTKYAQAMTRLEDSDNA